MKQFFTRPDPPLQWSLEISFFAKMFIQWGSSGFHPYARWNPPQPSSTYIWGVLQWAGVKSRESVLTVVSAGTSKDSVLLFDLTKLSLTLCESPPSVMQKWCNWAGKPTSFVGPVGSPQHVAALCVQASPSTLASRDLSFLWTALQQHSSMHVHCKTFPSSKGPMCSIGDKVKVGSFDASVFWLNLFFVSHGIVLYVLHGPKLSAINFKLFSQTLITVEFNGYNLRVSIVKC